MGMPHPLGMVKSSRRESLGTPPVPGEEPR